VRAELDDLSYYDLAFENAEMIDAVHLLAAQGEEFDQFVGRKVEVYIFA
jgi:hypothetical protein